MSGPNFFTTNSDFTTVFESLPWDRLVPLVEDGFCDPAGPRDTAEAVDLYREALTLVGEFAGDDIARRARDVDEAGAAHPNGSIEIPVPLRDNLNGLRDLGMLGLSLPRQYGGEGFPFTVSSMVLEIIARACPSTMVQYGFYSSPAVMLLRFGSEEIKRYWVPRLACGEVSGSVAMTEPQAGSDVGRIRTVARQRDGGWRITGRKQFITNGLGDICIVLARSDERSRGLEGLSLFLVERLRQEDGRTVENYVVERAERKICITASATCGLSFDEAHATLLGTPGGGWREILTFMNESRIAVGIQGIGTAQAAWEAARAYASQREQMGRPIREHPLVADMLLDMEASITGMRALAYEATVQYDMVQGLEAQMERLPSGHPRREVMERERRTRERYLRELTPLAKWLGAEETIRICRMAMQIHGGYGVIKEYDVERILRDSLILPIYEGTSQIQALMATKDLLKTALARPTTLLGGSVSPSLAGPALKGEAGRLYRQARSELNGAIRYLLRDLVKGGGARGLAAALRGRPSLRDEDTQYILLHAERLTAALAHLHAARLLARSVSAHPDRAPLVLRATRRAAAVAADAARAIESGDRSTLHAIARWQRGEA